MTPGQEESTFTTALHEESTPVPRRSASTSCYFICWLAYLLLRMCPVSQILSGKQHSLQLFGYSLAGNMDLDSNSYPDLAVGSLSDTVLIYRSLFLHT